MNEIQNYILNDIEALDLNVGIAYALKIATNHKLTHIPIINNGIFVGNLISEDLEQATSEQTIQDYDYALETFFVLNTTNWFDVLQKFSKYDTNIVPVLNQNNQYIGYYTLNDVIKLFSETTFLSEEGNTIVVEKTQQNYSFSEIAQIIESNNSKILGLFINQIKDNIVQVSIKITPAELNTILQTFRRYDYEVISNHLDDSYLNNLKNRSDYLDKYLNI